MSFVPSEDWRPRGIENLEPKAWDALRHCEGACVIAGPGAGKSEFLAQKAVYLLETGLCPPPQRVLAISFKSDAAENLAARVQKRCPQHLASRFTSLTFDAFTKSLVDRFHSAIPPLWRPSKPYQVQFPRRADVQNFLNATAQEAPAIFRSEIRDFAPGTFEAKVVGSSRLPLEIRAAESGTLFAINEWWQRSLNRPGESSLSFVCLNRLAELILRTNLPIVRALRATYPFVFVDEFQDTTYAQYDFLKAVFSSVRTSVTAVGDDKQRIMTWAGARPDSFEKFAVDFRATRFPLLFNFRSSPELVRIQHVVALALDGNSPATESQGSCKITGDASQVWVSQNKQVESDYVAGWIKNDIEQRGMSPRDYVILVKQLPDGYEADLQDSFAAVGLQIRNESHELGRSTLQDLLVDDLAMASVALLRLGSGARDPESWNLVSSVLANLRSIDFDDEIASRKIDQELTRFLKAFRREMAALMPSAEAATVVATRIHDFLNLGAFKRTYRSYGTGDLLEIMVDAFARHLRASAEASETWIVCLDAYEGISRIPMMTVHKSKGLEYDTVVFVGMDDQAWWSHSPGNMEGRAAFFVALSRAKQRAIFSFCHERGRRTKVAELYELLTEAGVPEITIPQ